MFIYFNHSPCFIIFLVCLGLIILDKLLKSFLIGIFSRGNIYIFLHQTRFSLEAIFSYSFWQYFTPKSNKLIFVNDQTMSNTFLTAFIKCFRNISTCYYLTTLTNFDFNKTS